MPEHWETKQLKRNLRLVTEKTDRRTNPVGLENIEGWSGRFIPTETEFAGDGISFVNGDILFGKLRPYLAKALLADVSGEAVGDFFVMRSRSGVCPRFVQYAILNRSFIDVVDGATYGSKMPRVSWEFVSAMMLATPPYEEQTRIARFLDHETAKIDTLIEEQTRLIELLKEKRQAVISQAVTKGLDPNVPMKDSGVEWFGEVPAHWVVSRVKNIASFITSGPRGWSDYIDESGEDVFLQSGDMDTRRPTHVGIGNVSLAIQLSMVRFDTESSSAAISLVISFSMLAMLYEEDSKYSIGRLVDLEGKA